MKKLTLIFSSLAASLLVLFSVGFVFAATNQDFKNDVKAGLLSLQANPTAQADKTSVENGENRVAGDENAKDIKEVDIEKEVEKEIETEKTSTDKPDTNTSTPSATGN